MLRVVIFQYRNKEYKKTCLNIDEYMRILNTIKNRNYRFIKQVDFKTTEDLERYINQ